jgi:hypothetical protein
LAASISLVSGISIRMSISTLRHKLIRMRELEFDAICSDDSRKILGDSWAEVKNILKSNPLGKEDREFLVRLSRNHNALASVMAKSEYFLNTLMNEACQELHDSDTCES